MATANVIAKKRVRTTGLSVVSLVSIVKTTKDVAARCTEKERKKLSVSLPERV